MDRNLQILGIANKAGLLAVGGDAAGAAARAGKAKLIISASDASEGSGRRACINAETGFAAFIEAPYTKNDFAAITRRGSPGTLTVLDTGLAARFLKGLSEAYPGRYGKEAELLEREAEKLKGKKKQNQLGKRRTAL
jgi:ribosomal protein L30E